MKRIVSAIVVGIVLALNAHAQGIYFDIGIGAGGATTTIDGEDVSDSFGSTVTDAAAELGFKLGYGPIAGIPVYIVGEVSGIGHRFSDDYNYIQFNSYLFGPGLVFYPLPFLQIGGSFGFSTVANQTDLPTSFYDSESGTAGNVYVAADLGKGNHGCLLGLKYSGTNNKLEESGARQKTSLFSFFIKYAYRHKAK